MNKRHILYVVADMGDFKSSRLVLARAAQEKGYIIHVAAPGAANDAVLKEFAMHGHDMPRLKRNIFSALYVVNCLSRIQKKIKPEMIHAITLKYSFLCGFAAGDSRKIFTIAGLGYVASNTFFSRVFKIILTPFLKYALKDAFLIVQNPDDSEFLIAQKWAPAHSITLIRGSGVDLNRFAPKPGTEEFPPIVLMPTRLLRDKGIDVFMNAARIIAEKKIPARFVIAGGAGGQSPGAISESSMRTMIQNTTVEWSGFIADMPGLYAKAAIVAYPSHYREGIPRALIEAAAIAKPIVTTDHPGCRETVDDGVNGFLIPVKNPEALANKIEKLLNDDGLRARMGAAGRKKAEHEFDVHMIAGQILKIYEN